MSILPALPSYSSLLQQQPPASPSGGANPANVSPQVGVGGWPPAGQNYQQPVQPLAQPAFNQSPNPFGPLPVQQQLPVQPSVQPVLQPTFQPNLQPPAQQPPAQQPPTPNFQTAPKPNFQQPPGQQSVDPLILQWEAEQKLPPGRFKTTPELFEHLYGTLEDVATKLEEYEKQTPGTPPANQPVPQNPQLNQMPAVATPELTQVAGVFQQSGMLVNENGVWVARNQLAAPVADQLNKAALEAQLRQAEMANPQAWIAKYGSEFVNQAVTPLQKQLQDIANQNQILQQRLESTLPRPDRDWVNQNAAMLYSKDAAGKDVPTQVGQLYTTAWETAHRQGIQDYGQIHEYALSIVGPLIQNHRPPQSQQTPWMAGVGNNPPDSGFNAPGSVFTNNVPHGQGGIPVGSDGFPRYSLLQQFRQQ